MRLGKISGWAWILGLCLLCAGSEKAADSTAAGPKAKAGAAKDEKAAADKPGESKVATAGGAAQEPEKSKVWTYDPTGKRDIFEIPPPRQNPCDKDPGTCYDLRQLWVDAIIYGSGMDMAHVILPGNKDMMVKVGDELGLNHGRVKQIRANQIVIEEIYVDPARPSDIHIIEKVLQMKK